MGIAKQNICSLSCAYMFSHNCIYVLLPQLLISGWKKVGDFLWQWLEWPTGNIPFPYYPTPQINDNDVNKMTYNEL